MHITDKLNNKTKSVIHIPQVIDMIFIAFCWLISLFVTNPFGDFPLNDDWSYGLAVKNLLDNGEFHPTGWTSMPLITNVLWGALFCIPVGFSFNALRLSTLILSLLGGGATYILMIELRQSRWLAVLTSLTLVFSPIYYALSHTFMTDVPCTAIMVIAAVFLVRNLKTDSKVALLLGTMFAVAATLSRQLAISLPLAFSIASILKNGTPKRLILRALIPLICCVGALLVFHQWLAATNRLPALYGSMNRMLLTSLANPKTIIAFACNAYVALLYLGCFLLPILIGLLGEILGFRREKLMPLLIAISMMLIAAAATSGVYGSTHLLMPNSGNIISIAGIGPLTLHDNYILGHDNLATLPIAFWVGITIMSFGGAVLLIAAIGLSGTMLASKIRSSKLEANEAAGAFLLLTAIIYLVPLILSEFWDRYLICTIPFLSGGIGCLSLPISQAITRSYRFAATTVLFCFALFAICGTRDYLTWNRIRWDALHHLMENSQVKIEDIDGGFEFNGWHLYDPRYKSDPKKSWWWVHEDTYRIGFGCMPGYTVTREYCYRQWLPPSTEKIVVLKKNINLSL